MKAQYQLQKKIVARARELGMVGQLPGFQGNVPVQLKHLLHDANITEQGMTGWMDSLDPHFAQVADLWMKELTDSFGTDHWYQLDGYFNGGTAPWLSSPDSARTTPSEPTTFRPHTTGRAQDPPAPDPLWLKRGIAAYGGLNRTDPSAVWSFQGFAFEDWKQSENRASALRGFIMSAPPGRFVIIDMDFGGGGWRKWDGAAYWGAPFVWTTLQDFGGTDGMKGNMTYAASVPAAAMAPHAHTNIIGSGFTMEGIDQNPAYYELVIDRHFSSGPSFTSLSERMVNRAHRRYSLTSPSVDATAAWTLLVESVYSQQPGVSDTTGVAHFHHADFDMSTWAFGKGRAVPTPKMCKVWHAWGHMIELASKVSDAGAAAGSDDDPSHPIIHSSRNVRLAEPLSYDLTDVGREVLAQLATPLSQNFTDALDQKPSLHAPTLNATGAAYAELLHDLDTLVATDTAFMLGPWIEMARALAAPQDTDCTESTPTARVPTPIKDCKHFYEWNARCQITTWNPVPEGASKVPDGPIDYASKHWSGLVADYYAKRIELVTAEALQQAAAAQPLDSAKMARVEAQHAYAFQVSTKKYPTVATGDPIAISKAMRSKYSPRFSVCT